MKNEIAKASQNIYFRRKIKNMRKLVSMFLVLVSCFALGITAYAAETPEDPMDVELVVPNDSPMLYDIPEPLETETVNSEAPSIAPRAVSTANEFYLLNFDVYPVVIDQGEYKYVDYYYSFTPASSSPRTINALMNAERQQVLKDKMTSLGYETVGWYLSGSAYMNCYIPYGLQYRIYNHNTNGETLYGAPIYRAPGTATVATVGLIPTDATSNYTYGFDGTGHMLVYYSSANTSKTLYPPFSMKATFTNQ